MKKRKENMNPNVLCVRVCVIILDHYYHHHHKFDNQDDYYHYYHEYSFDYSNEEREIIKINNNCFQ